MTDGSCDSSLISRPSTPPPIDRLQYAKNGGGRPGESSQVIHSTAYSRILDTTVCSHSYQQLLNSIFTQTVKNYPIRNVNVFLSGITERHSM